MRAPEAVALLQSCECAGCSVNIALNVLAAVSALLKQTRHSTGVSDQDCYLSSERIPSADPQADSQIHWSETEWSSG